MDYKASVIGYHNPHLHKGLTPKEFLDIYVENVLHKRAKKKDGWKRVKLSGWIKENYDDQLKFVARLFPNTLDVKK